MPKRTKEEIEEAKRKEKLRALQKGPDLDKYLGNRQRKLVSYAEGARIYSLNYYTFVKLAKRAGANIRIKKNVVIDLEKIEEFMEQNCKAENGGFDDV